MSIAAAAGASSQDAAGPSTQELAQPSAAFYLCPLSQTGDMTSTILLLEVPMKDWIRIRTDYTEPRKLFRYAIGCLYGCQMDLFDDATLLQPTDLDDTGVGIFYFRLGERSPHLIPRNLISRRPRSSSSNSTGPRRRGPVREAKARDSQLCVVTADNQCCEVAHILPVVTTESQLEDFNNLRGIHSRQLPCVDAMANLLTLYQPLHTVFDYGGSCFIPLPNWAMSMDDVQLKGYSLNPDFHLPDWTDDVGNTVVTMCHFAYPGLSLNTIAPAGKKCRINIEHDDYPPTWLLESAIGRSVFCAFGGPRLNAYHPESEDEDDGNGNRAARHAQDPTLQEGDLSGETMTERPTGDTLDTGARKRPKRRSSKQEMMDKLFYEIVFRPPTASEKEKAENFWKEEDERIAAEEEKQRLEVEDRIRSWRSSQAE